MKTHIEKIIADGVMAPSVKNNQPWEFTVKDNYISVFNTTKKEEFLHVSIESGSYTACGALIENMVISAKNLGYDSDVVVFPDDSNPKLIAKINLLKGDTAEDPLYNSIATRTTNRKEYDGKLLSHTIKEALIRECETQGYATLRIRDDVTSLSKLGHSLAVHEKILFENKYLHDFFYGNIIWNKSDEEKTGGFYIETLEFLPHQLKGVKLFKNWYVLKILNRILGVSNMISKENGEKYAKSGSIGIIIAKGTSKIDYVYAGRAMERVWLLATKLGIAMQPCAGVVYLMDEIRGTGGKEFSQKQQQLIQKATKDIMDTFSLHNECVPMIFRIGYAEEPTARSKRVKPKITYLS